MLTEALPVVRDAHFESMIAALDVQSQASLEAFWAQIEATHTPLVTVCEDAPDECIVTFIWRDASRTSHQVLLIVDTLTDQYRRTDLSPCLMKPVEGTDIWHISYRLRQDLRATYHFYPVAQQGEALSTGMKSREEWLAILSATQPDPLNPQTFPSRRGDAVLSVLELPQAIPQRWWQPRADVAPGGLAEHQVTSQILGNARRVWVYQPAEVPDTPCPLLIVLDGQVWTQTALLQSTLDNLIAEGAVPPLLAVAVDSLDGEIRGRELTCNADFIDFLTDELLPWVREQWPVTTDATRMIIAGQSYGGLAAAYAGYYAPQVFGNVITQSGSFWWPESEPKPESGEWLIRQFALAEKQAVRFYVSVGWQEWMLVSNNRHLRDVLMAKGYDLTYVEYNGGHDYICWRGGLADALIDVVQRWSKTEQVPLDDTLYVPAITARTTIPTQRPKSPSPQVVDSPRLMALQDALAADAGEVALQDFWAQVAAEGTPLIEPADAGHAIVTFLWRGGDEVEQVVLLANKFTDSSVIDRSVLRPLPGTDVWHISYRVRDDWRASYRLGIVRRDAADKQPLGDAAMMIERAQSVGMPASPEALQLWWYAAQHSTQDPLNQYPFNDWSVVSLANAPAQEWYNAREGVPQGALTEHQVSSDILGNRRRVWVYTPPGYTTAGARYGVVIMLDGQSWANEHPIQPTLDNLIAAGKIPPVVAVMPESLGFSTREREMAGHPPFADFIADELLPWAMAGWHITDEPARALIVGQSLGGLTAALVGLLAHQRVGNVLAQSGSFWWANGSPLAVDAEWIAQQYARMSYRTLRFYLEVGLQEWVLLNETRHLRNVLEAKGYDVTYSEYNGGHDDACYRGSIADGLMAIMRDWS